MTIINVIKCHLMSFYDIYDGHKMSKNHSNIGIKSTGLISTFQIQKNSLIITKGDNEKSNSFFASFFFYNPLYRVKIPEQPKNRGFGPYNFLCMLTLVHIMRKHHVHMDFSQKVFFDSPYCLYSCPLYIFLSHENLEELYWIWVSGTAKPPKYIG